MAQAVGPASGKRVLGQRHTSKVGAQGIEDDLKRVKPCKRRVGSGRARGVPRYLAGKAVFKTVVGVRKQVGRVADVEADLVFVKAAHVVAIFVRVGVARGRRLSTADGP